MQALVHHFMGNGRRYNLAVCVWLVCLVGFVPSASAQPEVYGKPDSSAFIRIPSDADDWTRHFRIGAMVGMNISAHFSMNGNFNINRTPGVYDDGYVRRDQTGDPLGYTTYWGYNDPSQYNSTAQTLTMHANTSFSASGSADESGSAFVGFDMAYGNNLWYWKHARVGWELGFGLLPIFITDNHPFSATHINQSVYTFDVGNPIGLPLPQAPYQAGPSGGGYPIPDTYSSETNRLVSGGPVTGSHTLDVMLYTFRLGPSFYWDLTEHIGMSLGAGPAVGIVSGDYKYDEIIGSTPGRVSGTEVVYGGYVNASLMYHAVANGDIFIGAQYMPMSDANFSGGGRAGRLNLSGQLYFTIGVNWPF